MAKRQRQLHAFSLKSLKPVHYAIGGGGLLALAAILFAPAKAAASAIFRSGKLPSYIEDMLDEAGARTFGAAYMANSSLGNALRAIAWNESQGNRDHYLGDLPSSPGCNEWCWTHGPSIGPMQVLQATAVQYGLWSPSGGVAPYTQAARDEYARLALQASNGDADVEQRLLNWGVIVFAHKYQEQGGNIYNALRAYNGSVTNSATKTYADRAIAWASQTYGEGAIS